MHATLHALGWALPKLGLALALIVFVPFVAYMVLVFAIVVGQTASTFMQ